MRDAIKALCDDMATRAGERRRCGAAAGKYTVAHACLVEALREVDAGDLLFDVYCSKMQARADESGRVFDRDKLAIVYRKPIAAPRAKAEPAPKPKPKAAKKRKAKAKAKK